MIEFQKTFNQYILFTTAGLINGIELLKNDFNKSVVTKEALYIMSEFSLLEYNFQNLNLLLRKDKNRSLITQFTNLKLKIFNTKQQDISADILDGLKVLIDLRIDKIDLLVSTPSTLSSSCNTLFKRNVDGINKLNLIRNKTLMENFIEYHTIESEILKILIQTHFLISNLHFIDPILNLNSTKSLLNQYINFGHSVCKGELKKSNFAKWLCLFYSNLLSKNSLYWCEIYYKQTTRMEGTQCLLDSCKPDLIKKIKDFHAKIVGDLNIYMIFDGKSQKYPFLGHGYYLPLDSANRSESVNAYYTIFSYPKNSRLAQYDQQLTINAIEELSKNDKTLTLTLGDDSKGKMTVSRLESRVYLTLIYDSNVNFDMSLYSGFYQELSDDICLFTLCKNLNKMIR